MMSEDELLKQALEDELEDSYQEYLTYALKGETQDLMQTSSEYRHKMEALCREAGDTEPKVVSIQPQKKKLARYVKAISGLAAAAAVVLLCFAGVKMLGRDKSYDSTLIAQNAPDEREGGGFVAGSKASVSDVAVEAYKGDTRPEEEIPPGTGQYPAAAIETKITVENQSDGPMLYQTEFIALLTENNDGKGVDGSPAGTNGLLTFDPTRKAEYSGGTLSVDGIPEPSAEERVQIEVFVADHDGITPSKILALYEGNDRVSFSEITRQEQEDGTSFRLEYRAGSDRETEPKEGKNIFLIVLYGENWEILAYRIV